MGILDRFRRKDKGVALDDNEKGYLYEQDPTREPKERQAPRKEVTGARRRYIGTWAPDPGMIRGLRFIFYLLTSLSALTTAALCLSVVVYYNTHGPVIKPAWGSLIAVIVFGLATPFILFGTMLVTPRTIRTGSALDIVNQTRMELLMLFALAAIWISGALALACDLRGQENCLWDGYWHYPKPSDFQDSCDRINWSVALAYTTFGLTAAQMAVIWLIAIYILLCLDQEVLTEHSNSMGSRAHLARRRALQQRKVLRAARESGVSTMGPRRSSRSSSFAAVDEEGTAPSPGPMSGGVIASRALPPTGGTNGGNGQPRGLGAGPMMGGSAPSVAITGPEAPRHERRRSSGSGVRFMGDDGEASSRTPPARSTEGEDPFEDQRGGYYGYESNEGLMSGRGRDLRV
ncbi:hypothetical protein JCM10449v2_005713 [Rhodotorula kratochvilovae]